MERRSKTFGSPCELWVQTALLWQNHVLPEQKLHHGLQYGLKPNGSKSKVWNTPGRYCKNLMTEDTEITCLQPTNRPSFYLQQKSQIKLLVKYNLFAISML